MNSNIYKLRGILLTATVAAIGLLAACEPDMVYEKTRLFRPVLGSPLESELNTIIVNMGDIKEATSYTIEVSRDSFNVVDYQFTVDTNYVVIDESLTGEALLFNTLYQVRATAHAASEQYDSRPADLGSVRTQRFPSILNLPKYFDVTDKKARVTWTPAGATVTKVKIFAKEDLRLKTPLKEYEVDAAAASTGAFIIDGLEPETAYQMAIYSGATLRGWVDYNTLTAGIYPGDAGVIDLTQTEDPDALGVAVDGAPDGAIILLKRGALYNFPSNNLNKSITIKGAYDLTPNRAIMFTTGNWNVDKGAKIDHIVFDDLEMRGEDIGGDYVFNINNSGDATDIQRLEFNNCEIHHFRGIMRLRSDVFVRNYHLLNSVIHDIGGYATFTCDTDGEGKAAVDNAIYRNSTFYRINTFMITRQNMQSFMIDACTVNEAAATGQRVFRFRGKDGFNDVLNGLTIQNTIWGHGWDEAESGNYGVILKEGLPNTAVTVVNTWGTADFSANEGTEIGGFPSLKYSKKAADLWAAPYDGNFQIKDPGFAGKFDAGDPRWRATL